MKGMDLIKYIYDNGMAENEIVLGVQGYILDPNEEDSDDVQLTKTDDGRLLISDTNDYSDEFTKRKYFGVTITETYEKTFKVYAKSEEEAEEIAEREYDNGNVENFSQDYSPEDHTISCIGVVPEEVENCYDEIEE